MRSSSLRHLSTSAKWATSSPVSASMRRVCDEVSSVSGMWSSSERGVSSTFPQKPASSEPDGLKPSKFSQGSARSMISPYWFSGSPSSGTSTRKPVSELGSSARKTLEGQGRKQRSVWLLSQPSWTMMPSGPPSGSGVDMSMPGSSVVPSSSPQATSARLRVQAKRTRPIMPAACLSAGGRSPYGWRTADALALSKRCQRPWMRR